MHREEKARRVRGMFSSIAERYDLANTLLSLGRDATWRRFAARVAEIGEGSRVLDVATGTGELAFEAAKRASLVVGADFSAEMLALAREKAERRGTERVKFVLCDALHLCFADERFDAALVAFGLRNFADPERALRELVRVVRQGGRVVVLEFTLPPNRFLRWLYSLYFFHVLPFLGGLITGRREAYAYLPRSVAEFPPPEEVVARMEKAGLENVRYHLLTHGTVAVYVGLRK
ncbi:MAG: bifunctional demethylmenaquinone methyltransferase/2-methoxy-6-polyprenyl-1,4-benzoquinol methylase UbiE [Euryarchaeota archaeon]|nr:bifunctional demethylmenaquinone methyltransferase/2-methoxy-6-polyprenyl-1,4-benzoquinol methylase UbiE [Euryarchaeota archaeon]